MGWFDSDWGGGSSFGFDDSAFKSTGSSLFSGGGFGGGTFDWSGGGNSWSSGFGGSNGFDWGGSADLFSNSSWLGGFVSSPAVESTASIFGTTADKLFGAVSKTLGDGWDWYQRQNDDTKGLLGDVLKGAAGAYLMGRQYDKQRDAQKERDNLEAQLRREGWTREADELKKKREEEARMREVPVLKVGSGRGIN